MLIPEELLQTLVNQLTDGHLLRSLTIFASAHITP